MAEYVVNGGAPLYGEVLAQGSKNSAVAVIMACLAVEGEVILRRVPRISDVDGCKRALEYLGAKVKWISEDTLLLDCRNARLSCIPSEICGQMRASTYLMGAELCRFGECIIPLFGGCDFGGRPVDLHGSAFGALGAVRKNDKGLCFPKGRAASADISFPRITVGGTVNALIAAARGNGNVVLRGCAREPHVCDTARFLIACGAQISGVGTDTLCIRGVKRLNGCEFELCGDMIEAGTFLIAGVATRGRVWVKGVCGTELISLGESLSRMGARVELGRDYAMADGSRGTVGTRIEATEYPGFPTDLHPQLVSLMAISEGTSVLREKIFGDKRFGYAREMEKQGLVYQCVGDTITVYGGKPFSPSNVLATDLRGGAAMVIAALSADGKSRIGNIEYIKRGYSAFAEKLIGIGGNICEI